MRLRAWDDLPYEMKNENVKRYYDLLYKRRLGLFVKRAFDFVVAVLIFLILTPLLIIISVAIMLDSKGPVMFRQVRVTQYGKTFRIFKFRTMVNNADKIGTQVTTRNDARVTKIGKFLRKLRFDEIPQLINIILGDMSFVGTRPEVVKYVDKYTDEMMATLLLPAGVTSEASILYKDEDRLIASADDADETYINEVLPKKMDYNLKSLANFSLFSDIKTMIRTVLAVIKNDEDEKNVFEGISTDNNEVNLMSDKISIITPTYNCGDFIAETIESVISQTYQNWELIIVDDCSTDNTKKVVEDYVDQDHRIKYYLLKENLGAAEARNKAMELATGSYMAFLDSDDLWHEEKLARQLTYMKKNDYVITCTAYEQIDETGVPLNKVIKTKTKTNYNGVLLSCPIGNSTVMYDVKKLGKFIVPNIRKRNDDALWLKMLKVEKYVYGMPEVLMQYRIRSNSISSNKLKLIKYHWNLYRDIENLSVLRSLFHICFWGILKITKVK